MKLSRRLRSATALLALLGVLLAQLAVAAYACPGAQARDVAATESGAGRDSPCEGLPDLEPALCSAHCQQGDQLHDKAATPLPAVLGTAGLAVDLAASRSRTPPRAPGLQSSLLARATAPSVAVRHCCFRI